MSKYLVETHLPRGRAAARELGEERATQAAEAFRQVGGQVCFDHSILVPEDELCFYVFEATSGPEAALVAQAAGLDPLRVVEAIPSPVDDHDQEEP